MKALCLRAANFTNAAANRFATQLSQLRGNRLGWRRGRSPARRAGQIIEEQVNWSWRALLVSVAVGATTPAHAGGAGERAYYRGDYAQAAYLLLPKANAGAAVAQSFLGYQYQYGLGVPKSYEEAARWFHRAAEQGEPTAQFFLGLLYDRGQGVAEDPVEAEKWLDLAAAHAPRPKREHWATMRDTIAAKMTMDELAEARRRAVSWYPLPER
jgi:TPR repeat protein